MIRPPPPTVPLPDSPYRTPSHGNGDTRTHTAAPDPPPDPDLIETQILLDALDRVARSIFSVGLSLAAARNLATGPQTARLDQAIDDLDDLLHELRHTEHTAHTAMT